MFAKTVRVPVGKRESMVNIAKAPSLVKILTKSGFTTLDSVMEVVHQVGAGPVEKKAYVKTFFLYVLIIFVKN